MKDAVKVQLLNVLVNLLSNHEAVFSAIPYEHLSMRNMLEKSPPHPLSL